MFDNDTTQPADNTLSDLFGTADFTDTPDGDVDDFGLPFGDAEPAASEEEPKGQTATQATQSTTPAASATPTTPPEQQAAPTTPSDPLAEPPKTWRKEAGTTWATLPLEVRQEIHKREEDIFRGIENYKADAAFGKGLRGAISPFLQTLQQYNIDPAQHVQQLLQAQHTLALGTPEQRVAMLQRIAADYQVDLSRLTQDAASAPYVDPAVASLQAELRTIKSQLNAAEASRQATTRQTLERQVETFAADPANVHFNEVAADMAALLDKGISATLQEAYERAVWSNPITRAKEQARQQAAATSAAQAAEAERVAKAKAATAAVVRTSPKSGSTAAPLGSIDDTLRETLASIRARG